jgi:hypothetical protein
MLIPCETCHNDPEICECCSFCGRTDCECGPCDLCPSYYRRFHINQKDSLCDECLICNICKHPTMGWDDYDEAWTCSKCNELWEEYDIREIQENPAHNARKDIPKHKKYSIWKSLFGKAREAKCLSCKIMIRPPKFCVIDKGGVPLPICVQCSKGISTI